MAAATTSKRMTQTEIISQLAEKSGMKKADAKEFFNSLAALATSEVKKNGEFTLPGFGKLVKATRKAREGRNPATGKPIKIPAKTTVKFRLGKAMKDAVGGGK
jgi:DNA-binding protein HU-beta